MAEKSGGGFDVFDAGGGRGDGFAVAAEAFDVELDGFADELLGLVEGLAGGDASGEVGDPGGVSGLGFVEDDGVLGHGRHQRSL